MKIHELKTWPEFFEPILSGEKRFELRFDDRGFRAGDKLLLREYLPKTKQYTGRETQVNVLYILSGFPGLAEGWVVMSICEDTEWRPF